MIAAIDQHHPLFDSAEYRRDAVAFDLLELIKQSPALLVSNEADFIVGMSAPAYPIWVWTRDAVSDSALAELGEYLWAKTGHSKTFTFVAKPQAADALAAALRKHGAATERRVRMESYANPRVTPPKNSAADLQRPRPEDAPAIAACMAAFTTACFGTPAAAKDFLPVARQRLALPYFFIVREEDAVAAMAQSTRETARHIAINMVYTRPASRGKGYAAALAAHLSCLILAAGKLPVLYADLANPAANKAYRSVGFLPAGRVDEVTLTWP